MLDAKKDFGLPIALRPVSAAGRAEKVDYRIILARGDDIHNHILTQMENARYDAEKITSIDIDNYRAEMADKGGFPVSLRGDSLFVKIPIPGLRTMDAWGNVRQAYDEVSKKEFIKGAKKKLEGWDFDREQRRRDSILLSRTKLNFNDSLPDITVDNSLKATGDQGVANARLITAVLGEASRDLRGEFL